MNAVEFPDVDLDRLQWIADRLHESLPRHLVIGLSGTLGAGKTRLTQCLAVAAGIDVADVTSPTFTIVQHYCGTRRIHHIDAYRLADEDEFAELGGDELLEDPDAWVVIEWPQRIAGCLPADTLMIELELAAADPSDLAHNPLQAPLPDTGRRLLRFQCPSERLYRLLADIRTAYGPLN